MDVRNCKLCKNLFNYNGNPLCPACSKKMEERFMEVKTFIRENPASTMSTISAATEVPVQQLKRWVREERLTFSKDSGVVIQCENCGKSILTGRYCEECKRTMTNKLDSMYAEKKQAPVKKKDGSARMRFLDH